MIDKKTIVKTLRRMEIAYDIQPCKCDWVIEDLESAGLFDDDESEYGLKAWLDNGYVVIKHYNEIVRISNLKDY